MRRDQQDLPEYHLGKDQHLGDPEVEIHPIAIVATEDPFTVDQLILTDTIEEIMVHQVRDPDIMIDLCHEQQIMVEQLIRPIQVEKTALILFITDPMQWKQEHHPLVQQVFDKFIQMETRQCTQDLLENIMVEIPETHQIVLLRLLLWGRDHAPEELTGHQSFMDRRQGIHLYPRSYRETHQLWLHLRMENHHSLKLNLLEYLSQLLQQ